MSLEKTKTLNCAGMRNPRNVTGKSTIPAGILQFGTLTSQADPTRLKRSTIIAWAAGVVVVNQLVVYHGQVWRNITGTNTAATPPNDNINWALYQASQKAWNWIYLPTNGAGNQVVAKILGIVQNMNESASTYDELYYLDAAVPTTGAVAFQIVEGNLKSYGVDNNGGAAGQLGGTTFAQNEILNQEEKNRLWGQQYQDVVTVDGTGTNLYIVEN